MNPITLLPRDKGRFSVRDAVVSLIIFTAVVLFIGLGSLGPSSSALDWVGLGLVS